MRSIYCSPQTVCSLQPHSQHYIQTAWCYRPTSIKAKFKLRGVTASTVDAALKPCGAATLNFNAQPKLRGAVAPTITAKTNPLSAAASASSAAAASSDAEVIQVGYGDKKQQQNNLNDVFEDLVSLVKKKALNCRHCSCMGKDVDSSEAGGY